MNFETYQFERAYFPANKFYIYLKKKSFSYAM